MSDSVPHTPGPWMFTASGEVMHRYTQPFAIAQFGEANLVAGVFGDVRGGTEAAEANARLIALAPEMFDIVRTVVMICDSGDTNMAELALMENSPIVGECRALLAKARGDQ